MPSRDHVLNKDLFQPSVSYDTSFAYSLDEIEDFMDDLDFFSEDQEVIATLELLAASSIFKTAITSEAFFVALRNQNISNEDLVQKINVMLDVIMDTEEMVSAADAQHKPKLFLKSALHYCLISIDKSLKALSADDRILKFQITKQLKALIELELKLNYSE